MSKDQLTKIKNVRYFFHDDPDSDLYKDWQWLIEQAERVQELELEISDWRVEVQKWQKFYKESEGSHSETKELLKSIVNQNKRYREALERIARINIEQGTVTISEVQAVLLARKTLEGEQ